MEHAIKGLHHITLCTGTAQMDVDFFVKVIGQRFVKKTLLYDGREPVYHLYFADEVGTPSTVMTTFPMRRTGIKARKGNGQFSAISYSIPEGSIAWWETHIKRSGIEILGRRDRFGQKYLAFLHPAGIEFEVVEAKHDDRKPWESSFVPHDHAVRGFHDWTATVRERDDMDEFMHMAWNFKQIAQDGKVTRYEVNGGGAGRTIDIAHEADLRQGSWTFGEGIIHHGAFEVPDLSSQAQLKFDVEGIGFTDFSDRKNRGYFESVYVRTPGGPMFEATHSLGFDVDEAPSEFGKDFKVSPQFRHMKDELLERLNDPIAV